MKDRNRNTRTPPRRGEQPTSAWPSATPRSVPPRSAQPAEARQRARFAVLVLLGCLALVICLIMWVLSWDRGPTEPQAFDPGQAAAAWDKNENGIFFNTAGGAILEATQKGIDVSRYQGEIDWNKAKAAGIDFAVLRCGYGNEWNGQGEGYDQDDLYWRRNADACTRLGIPFGAYLYSYATTVEQARLEADHAARLLGLIKPPYDGLEDYTATPYQLSLPFYYDLEDPSITGLYPGEMAKLTAAFFEQLASHGYKGEQGIYASLNWVRGRLQDPGFDPWRGNLWIARFNTELGYTGPYRMWQSTYQEPGARYGVQSDTVDIDFRMEPLAVTSLSDAKADIEPVLSNDTYTSLLWLAARNDRVTLHTNEPAEEDGGQRIFWSTSDEKVATIDRHGRLRARGEGNCTVTATRLDGRLSAQCTVQVGAVTVPIYATGALKGACGAQGEDGITLADLAALKAGNAYSVLLDAGNSMQGSAATALTGGMDMTSAFSAAGYDLQAVGCADLAFGVARLRSDAATAAGPTLASNLRDAQTSDVLFARSVSWNGNRITNGMNVVLQRAGHKIGFFVLTDTGDEAARYTVRNEGVPVVQQLAQCASEQVAALNAEGAQAIVCICAGPFSEQARTGLDGVLAELGVTAVIDGGLYAHQAAALSGMTLPLLPAATGLDSVAQLELTFQPDGAVSAAVSALDAQALAEQRAGLDPARQAAYDGALAALQMLEQGDEEVKGQTLFTLLSAGEGTPSVSFGNYVASLFESMAKDDVSAWPAETAGYPLYALVGGAGELTPGDVTRGALLEALPAGTRIQLVQATDEAYRSLCSQDVSRTYIEEMRAGERVSPDTPVCIVADTASLAALPAGSYTVLRDYGDTFWAVRMALNDATGGFTAPFQLPEAPQTGAGRST